jgi:hypothetical protein
MVVPKDARQHCWSRHYNTSIRPRVRFCRSLLNFLIDLMFSAAPRPWVDSPVTERGSRNCCRLQGAPVTPEADNLTAVCEPIVCKMWEPPRFGTLSAPAAYYGENFTFVCADDVCKWQETYCHVYHGCVVVWLITLRRGFGLVTGFIHYGDL